MKLSVIVTIYNKKRYLKRCVESILSQNVSDMDIILVDDGSSDGSEIICDEFSTNDDRITVFHKQNGGASSARRAGLKEAVGDYILFVDADDWIEDGSIGNLIERLERSGADIVTGEWILHDSDTVICDIGNLPEGMYVDGINKKWFAANMIYSDKVDRCGINGTLNTKIIRRELLKKVYDLFPLGIVYAEDDFMAYACMAKATSVEVTHVPLYHYEMHYDSVSHSKINTFLGDLEKGYHFYVDIIKENPNYSAYKKQMEVFVQRALYFGIEKYMGFETDSVISWYACNTDGIPKGSRIILYGAGKVGKCYHRQFINDNAYSVIGWLDKEYESYRIEGYDVDSIEMLSNMNNMDIIVIAVADARKAESISDQIVNEYGIEKSRIYWRKPENMLDNLLEGRDINHG